MVLLFSRLLLSDPPVALFLRMDCSCDIVRFTLASSGRGLFLAPKQDGLFTMVFRVIFLLVSCKGVEDDVIGFSSQLIDTECKEVFSMTLCCMWG